MWANGATGLLNANSLNSLKTAISGLSKEQALLVLSTKNLSKAQTEQVLSAAGLLNVEKQLTAAQLSERLTKELNSKTDAEALLINSGLITQKELEENATIKVTAAKINEAVANGTLSASDAGVIAGALGITGVNTGATISFDLLTASIWANIKALGAWLVTNPIGWAILGGTAIFGLAKAYDALTDSVEEVKERTDALLETYNSAISEANSNAQTIESLASRYEKLSKGVNNLGENVSLTAEEYSEYNDIVNQIADMFPTMITGYTDEGNAILSLKGNVEELRDAYKEAQKEAYNLLIVSGKDNDGNDIITNYQNQVHGNESWLSKQSSYIDGEAGAKDAIEIITRLTGALTPDEFRQTYNQLYEEYKNIWNSDKIQDALKSSGFEELTHAPKWSEITVEDLANVRYSAQATIQTYNAEINSQLRNVQTLANAYLMTNSDYVKLDEQSKTAASLLVNSINENIANEFSSKEDVGTYVGKLVTSISNNDEVQNALKDLFTMDSSDMPIGEVRKATDSYINTIATVIDENPAELKVRLGFDDSDTQPLINNVKEKLQDEFNDKVGELTLDELHIAAEQIEIPESTLLSWDELIEKIKEVQNTLPSTTFDISTYKDKIDDIQSSISTLRSALESLNKGELSKVSVIDLMQEFPSLAPYVDLTAEGFGNLSEGLSTLISQEPEKLIQEFNALKEALSTDEERHQVDLLIDSLQRLSSYGDTGIEAYAGTIGNTWNDTADVIEGVTTQFENLAKVQEVVAHGLTMTATQAAELAKMYPEILTKAQVTANGQITLNRDVVDSILQGDKSIINGQITKLEADKAELTAKKEYAEAQLNIIKQVGEGEGKITQETAQYVIDTANSKLKYLIEAGNEESKAYAEVAESMAGNVDEYNKVVAQAAEDSANNMNNSAVSMAETMHKNSIHVQESISNIQEAAWNAAESVMAIGTGEIKGKKITAKGGGSSKSKKIKTETHTGKFDPSYSEYTPTEINLDEFQSQLEIDIQGYADAISNIESQIEVLRNLQATFDKNGGIGGHGYADKIKQLEKEKDKINNAAKNTAKDAKDAAEQTAETFNWVETAISRVQRVIQNLGNIVSATWRNWTQRNSALKSEITEVRKEISLQQSAYETYMQKAESVGLSDHYKNLVKNGGLSIESIADDTLKEQIKEYQEWWIHATLPSNG